MENKTTKRKKKTVCEETIVPLKEVVPIVENQSVSLTVIEPPTSTELVINKDNASDWVREKFVEKIPELLNPMVEAMKKGLENGDSSVLRMVAEAIGVLQSKTGPTFINNNVQQNLNTGSESKVSVESLIREMDKHYHEQRRNKKRPDSEIIDAEIIE